MADVQLVLTQDDDGQWHVAPEKSNPTQYTQRWDDMSWPVPPGNARPPGKRGPGETVLGDDLVVVDPERIIEAIRDYTITDSWCAPDGDRIMLKLEGLDLPSITLSIDPTHIVCPSVSWKCDGCDNQGKPWVTALVDPV